LSEKIERSARALRSGPHFGASYAALVSPVETQPSVADHRRADAGWIEELLRREKDSRREVQTK
jgi:hypothetical protein